MEPLIQELEDIERYYFKLSLEEKEELTELGEAYARCIKLRNESMKVDINVENLYVFKDVMIKLNELILNFKITIKELRNIDNFSERLEMKKLLNEQKEG